MRQEKSVEAHACCIENCILNAQEDYGKKYLGFVLAFVWHLFSSPRRIYMLYFFSTNGERTLMNIEPPSYFFRFLNLQNKSVAAQFDSCSEWLKRHCPVLVCILFKQMTCMTSYLLLLYLLATFLASFGQKQASSRNVYILILKCTRWLHIPLNQTSSVYFHIVFWDCVR